jgi:hypothetical protein
VGIWIGEVETHGVADTYAFFALPACRRHAVLVGMPVGNGIEDTSVLYTDDRALY